MRGACGQSSRIRNAPRAVRDLHDARAIGLREDLGVDRARAAGRHRPDRPVAATPSRERRRRLAADQEVAALGERTRAIDTAASCSAATSRRPRGECPDSGQHAHRRAHPARRRRAPVASVPTGNTGASTRLRAPSCARWGRGRPKTVRRSAPPPRGTLRRSRAGLVGELQQRFDRRHPNHRLRIEQELFQQLLEPEKSCRLGRTRPEPSRASGRRTPNRILGLRIARLGERDKGQLALSRLAGGEAAKHRLANLRLRDPRRGRLEGDGADARQGVVDESAEEPAPAEGWHGLHPRRDAGAGADGLDAGRRRGVQQERFEAREVRQLAHVAQTARGPGADLRLGVLEQPAQVRQSPGVGVAREGIGRPEVHCASRWLRRGWR